MSAVARFIFRMVFFLLPSPIKVWWLRFRGHQVGDGVYIGFVYLDVRRIKLGDNVVLLSLTVFKGLELLECDSGSRVGRYNLFTSASENKGVVKIGSRSVITMRHYLDIQAVFSMGADSILAGIGSSVFTHQKGIRSTNELANVVIGDRVSIGARCLILPGVVIPSNVLVGGGVTVRRSSHLQPYSMLVSHNECVDLSHKEVSFFEDDAPLDNKKSYKLD